MSNEEEQLFECLQQTNYLELEVELGLIEASQDLE